jgi:GAF domain-containing protein
MPMRATTVRFDDALWELLEREARASGVSAAQFVRDATILRVAFQAARRGDDEAQATIEDVAAGALRRPKADDTVLSAVRDRRRLKAVETSGLLDIRDDPAFDRLTRMATKLLDVPVALVSIVDADRQVFASCLGLGPPWSESRETPLSHSFCQHAVAAGEPLVVPDAREHPVLKDNLAIRDLGVIAYLGIPLYDDAQRPARNALRDRPRAAPAGRRTRCRRSATSPPP